MKGTKLMLLVIFTYLMTLLFFGCISYAVSTVGMRTILTSPEMAVFMTTLGNIPSIVVGRDYWLSNK